MINILGFQVKISRITTKRVYNVLIIKEKMGKGNNLIWKYMKTEKKEILKIQDTLESKNKMVEIKFKYFRY